jgi:hypothetical protein
LDLATDLENGDAILLKKALKITSFKFFCQILHLPLKGAAPADPFFHGADGMKDRCVIAIKAVADGL